MTESNPHGALGDEPIAVQLKRLEEIVRRLESDDTSLDEAIQIFEEGVARLRAAKAAVANTELVINRVIEDASGVVRTEPWQP